MPGAGARAGAAAAMKQPNTDDGAETQPKPKGARGAVVEFRAQAHDSHMDLRQKMVSEIQPDMLWAARFVNHHFFLIVVNVFISINVIQMGIATDFRGGALDTLWEVCEQFFTTFFLLEFLVKVWALRVAYFHDGWNCFDLFIVVISVIGAWILPAVVGSDSNASDIIALPRMLRLLRMLRMMRVIPQFRVLFDGILTSFHAMFWVALLSLFVLYMFGVAMVNVLGREESGFANYNDDGVALISDTENQAFGWNNYQYFGTVSRSIMTLLNVVVMTELDTIVRPVFEIHPLIAMVLMALAFLFTFCFFNILIGMIMDSVMQSVKCLENEFTRKERRLQMNFAHGLADILFEAEKDNSQDAGTLSEDKIQELIACASGLGLPHGFSFTDLMDMFDPDGSGQGNRQDCLDCIFNLVTNTEFQNNCLLQKGIGQIKRKIHDFQTSMKEDVAKQHEVLLSEIRRLVPPGMPAAVVRAPVATTVMESDEMPDNATIEFMPVTKVAPRAPKHSVRDPLLGAALPNPQHTATARIFNSRHGSVSSATDQDALGELYSVLAATRGYLDRAGREHELAGVKLQEAQLVLEHTRAVVMDDAAACPPSSDWAVCMDAQVSPDPQADKRGGSDPDDLSNSEGFV